MSVAWLNFLTYFRYIPLFGIFILMFNDILKSVAKFAVILVIFIVAFGLAFHILFINQQAFDSTFYSLLKTYVMMIGEYEFEGIITEHDDPEASESDNIKEAANLPFPVYSSLIFTAFVMVMSIIIMNLMVGLAVDDIAEIQANAEFQKLSLNVSLLQSSSFVLPSNSLFLQTTLVLESERFLSHLRCCFSTNFMALYTSKTQTLTRCNAVQHFVSADVKWKCGRKFA